MDFKGMHHVFSSLKSSLKGRMMPGLRNVLSIVAIIAAAGCGPADRSPVIARVGKSVLTVNDLYESIPSEYRDRITREQNINYVKQWIDAELFYQEALRRHIDREPAIRARMEKTKRDLLGAEMIARLSPASGSMQISEAMIQEYYEKSKNTFVRDRDVVRHAEITVADEATAMALRKTMTPDNFLDIAEKHSQAPVQDPRFAPFVPINELPAALAQTIEQIPPGGISAPVKTESGYSIIRVLDHQKAGAVIPLDEVREEIANRLAAQLQRTALDQVLADLRNKNNVQYNFDQVPAAAPAGN
jgi:parvulin-like peptidyl-prolyl isomerase